MVSLNSIYTYISITRRVQTIHGDIWIFNRHPTRDNRQVNRGIYKTMTEDNCFEHKWVEDFIY